MIDLRHLQRLVLVVHQASSRIAMRATSDA